MEKTNELQSTGVTDPLKVTTFCLAIQGWEPVTFVHPAFALIPQPLLPTLGEGEKRRFSKFLSQFWERNLG
jgi:hypothetical protein